MLLGIAAGAILLVGVAIFVFARNQAESGSYPVGASDASVDISVTEPTTGESSTESGEVTEPAEETTATDEESTDASEETVAEESDLPEGNLMFLKDVGEPYLDRFGLSPADFRKIKDAGYDIIEGNFDICASDQDVQSFLVSAHDAGLKVVLFAGAGEAEWGYPCDDDSSSKHKPEWQKDKVQKWVKKWSAYPALYAWDISNEDGQNFPNAQEDDETWIERGHAVSLKQLQTAYRDVKAADPKHPILIRMNGWFFYDYDSNFFRAGNAFGPGVADIVMINAYSNVEDYFPDMVGTIASRAKKSIRAINPSAKIFISLGAWKESPMWFKPSIAHLRNDRQQVLDTGDIAGIAIFKYGASGSEWYMPKDVPDLWQEISTW